MADTIVEVEKGTLDSVSTIGTINDGTLTSVGSVGSVGTIGNLNGGTIDIISRNNVYLYSGSGSGYFPVNIQNLYTLHEVTNVQKITAINKLSEISDIKLVDKLSEISDIKLVDELTKITNIDSIDKVDELTKITNIDSIDKVDELAKITNIDSIDVVDKLTELDHINNLKQVDTSILDQEVYTPEQYVTNLAAQMYIMQDFGDFVTEADGIYIDRSKYNPDYIAQRCIHRAQEFWARVPSNYKEKITKQTK